MFLKLKKVIKNNNKYLYDIIRKCSINCYGHIRQWRLASFKSPIYYPFSYNGISFHILLDPVNGLIDHEIAWKGVYEEDTLDFYVTQLKEGQIYVDIGSNIGQHALFASRLVGDSGHVISFEPIRRLYAQQTKSIIKNSIKNITTMNVACGNFTGEAIIYLRDSNAGGSSLVPFIEEGGVTESVKVVVADSVLNDFQRIDFIKIDAEGFEYEVLQGLGDTLKRHMPRLFIEYSPEFYVNTKSGPDHNGVKLLRFLVSYGYTFINFNDNCSTIADPVLWGVKCCKEQCNLFCIPQN